MLDIWAVNKKNILSKKSIFCSEQTT